MCSQKLACAVNWLDMTNWWTLSVSTLCISISHMLYIDSCIIMILSAMVCPRSLDFSPYPSLNILQFNDVPYDCITKLSIFLKKQEKLSSMMYVYKWCMVARQLLAVCHITVLLQIIARAGNRLEKKTLVGLLAIFQLAATCLSMLFNFVFCYTRPYWMLAPWRAKDW